MWKKNILRVIRKHIYLNILNRQKRKYSTIFEIKKYLKIFHFFPSHIRVYKLLSMKKNINTCNNM